MKIAVTYEDGQVFQHFGHTEQFMLYEAEDGEIKNRTLLDTNGNGHGALAGFLAQNGAEVLICGGIGGGAQMALREAGIRLFGGVSGITASITDPAATTGITAAARTGRAAAITEIKRRRGRRARRNVRTRGFYKRVLAKSEFSCTIEST